MAFIFVPNADGGFDEGNRQTNPDTGVEYIYVDGAWRALGPKIEDEFDTLDDRYVNTSGDTMHGTLMFDRGRDTDPNLLISPNSGDTSTSIYAMNNGALRFRSLAGNNTDDNSTTHITIGKDGLSGGPETYIYHVVDPQEELWAVNKRYVDNIFENDITMNGDYLYLNSLSFITDEVRFNPPANNSGVSRVRLMRTDLGNTFQFTSHPSTGGSLQSAKVHIEIKNEENEEPETILKFLPEPTVDHQAATKKYVDENGGGGGDYLPITGGELTGPAKLEFNRGDKPYSQLHISPNGGTDYATNIFAMGGGQIRFRTCPADVESTYTTHIIIDENDGNPVTKIYKLQAPTRDDDPTTRKWVEEYLTDYYVDLDSQQTITGKKTFGSIHNSSTNAINLKGKVQINGSGGNLGQVLTSGGSSKTVQWANVVANGSTNAGTNGSFYEANNALYYRTH